MSKSNHKDVIVCDLVSNAKAFDFKCAKVASIVLSVGVCGIPSRIFHERIYGMVNLVKNTICNFLRIPGNVSPRKTIAFLCARRPINLNIPLAHQFFLSRFKASWDVPSPFFMSKTA
jgi:hypothetical protein